MKREITENDCEDYKEFESSETRAEKDRLKKEMADHFESTYSLKPDEKYEANQYRYETDKLGRIEKCEGTIRLEKGKINPNHQSKAGGESREMEDDGGHLIARRFGGSEKVDNIVPMDRHLNRGEYKKMENEWANKVEDGSTVDVKIRCKYEKDSQRPSEIIVRYQVTDETGYSYREVRRFKNS
ncbi:DNA/RNA non-specific endonuclease [[Clostridium] leptum]|nr:DNA/RNA non-specific endonuclease [[Clostridium] leptum]